MVRGEPQNQATSRFYGWWLLAILTVIVFLATAGGSLSFAFLLNWPDAQYQSDQAALFPGRLLGYLGRAQEFAAFLLPVGGWLIDRYGARRVVLFGLPVIGLAVILAGSAPGLPVLFAALSLVAVSYRVSVMLPAAATVNNWFHRRRVIALAVLLFAHSVVGVLFHLVRESIGRAPVIAVGVLILAALAPARLVGNRPEDYGQHPDGASAGDAELTPDYSWRDAIKTRAFWLLILAWVCLESLQWIAITSLDGLLVQREAVPVKETYAVWTTQASRDLFTMRIVLGAGFVLVGGLIGGWMRIRNALLLLTLVHLAAIVTLLVAGSLWLFFLAVALLAAGSGGSAPLKMAAIGLYFGRSRFATLYGTAALAGEILSFAGTLLAAGIYDLIDDPTVMLAIGGILSLAAFLAYRAVGYPQLAPSQRQPAN